MSEIIHSAHGLRAIDGVLITKDYLQRLSRTRSLEERAKRDALKIIKQAERDAHAIREGARLQGFESGVLMNIDALCEFLNNLYDSSQSLTERLQKQTLDKLNAILSMPAVIEPLLSEWLQGCSQEKASRVEISLNPSRQELLPVFEQYFSERKIAVSYVFSADEGYAFRSGEFSLRYSPDRLSALFNEELLNAKGEFDTLFESLSREVAENIVLRLNSTTGKSE